MPKKTFTPEQIVGKLRQIGSADGEPGEDGSACGLRKKPGSPTKPTIGGGKSMVGCRWSRPGN